jgi:spore maturation protein A
MAMFLAINTSSIVLVPFTMLSYRVLKGSSNPAEPIAGIVLATLASTLAAIIITRRLSRWRRYRVAPSDTQMDASDAASLGGGNS